MFLIFFDSSHKWQFGFQDPASPIMEGIIDLHHHIVLFLTIILFFVLWFFFSILNSFYGIPEFLDKYIKYQYHLRRKHSKLYSYKVINIFFNLNKINHNHTLEVIWTIMPSIILILIAIPSFTLLYSMDEIIDPSVTIKVIGHQWYWAYEYGDFVYAIENNGLNENILESPIKFDSYMIPTDELINGQLRLLAVDNPIVLPVGLHIRVITTAADVLHSWAIPSLGLKIDCVPGRLNQTCMFIKRKGIFYGQCSEICGVNHGFMPIVIRAVNILDYRRWLYFMSS